MKVRTILATGRSRSTLAFAGMCRETCIIGPLAAMSFPKPPIVPHSGECRLVVVQDHLQPCPYREGETARMPLRLPVGEVSPAVTDWLLASGYRRSGDFVYMTQCPACQACKPTRLEPARFRWSTSLRRVLRRGDHDLTVEWNAPTADPRRVDLFNEHRCGRRLARDDHPVTAESYSSFLVDSCCDSLELAIYLDQTLVAISIMDVGADSLSAVYTHFDPAASRYSLGTYAVLKQIQWAVENDRRYLYLGMYVSENPHLNYKARFVPQQRLDQGHWTDVEI